MRLTPRGNWCELLDVPRSTAALRSTLALLALMLCACGGDAATDTAGDGGANGAGTGGARVDASAPASGGSASCGDTQSDPANCGQCGHACLSRAPGACADGVCAPALVACVTESDGFETCNDVCEGRGQTCVAGGCMSLGGELDVTSGSWDSISLDLCLTRLPPPITSSGACDEPLRPWDDEHTFRSCCCSDTQ